MTSLFSDLVARLWLIHPFREENTRTVMRFAKRFPLNSKLLRDYAHYVRIHWYSIVLMKYRRKDTFYKF